MSPTTLSMASPDWCPRVSLMTLKSSMSAINTANPVPWRWLLATSCWRRLSRYARLSKPVSESTDAACSRRAISASVRSPASAAPMIGRDRVQHELFRCAERRPVAAVGNRQHADGLIAMRQRQDRKRLRSVAVVMRLRRRQGTDIVHDHGISAAKYSSDDPIARPNLDVVNVRHAPGRVRP